MGADRTDGSNGDGAEARLAALYGDGSAPQTDDDTDGAATASMGGGSSGETLIGTPGDDTIIGTKGDDLIKGGAGDDLLKGVAGNNTIFGGDGNDTIYGGKGDDKIFTGDGENKVYAGAGNDTIFATPGDTIDGGDGFDTLYLKGQLGNIDDIHITSSTTNKDGSVSKDGYITFGDGSPKLKFISIEKIIPCFTPGTAIATPQGERPVESLREGDKIITRDNGIQEIRWIGQREMSWNGLAASPHLKPILVEKGALGNGLPERDMLVSPQHRLLVANERTALYFEEHEVLVAAKHLLNHRGVREVDSLGVTYVHFMCDRHEVVLSNGAWSETFQPGDYTLKGMGNAQRLELFELFPDLQTEAGREAYGAARKTLKRHEAQLLAS